MMLRTNVAYYEHYTYIKRGTLKMLFRKTWLTVVASRYR